MPDIFSIVFPVFALIALGYGLVVSGILSLDVGDGLSKFVFTIPLPLLVFRALATSDVGSQTPWTLWLGYFFCAAIVWSAAMLVVRFGFGREGSVLAVAGLSATFSNLVLLGIPILTAIFGEVKLLPLLLLLTVHLPVMLLVSSVMVEWFGQGYGGRINWLEMIFNVAKGLATNPIIIGIVAGGIWGLFRLPIPDMASVVIDKIAPSAVPLSLMAMGMGLKKFGLRGNILPGFVLALLKMVALPALFWTVSHSFLSLPEEWMVVITIGAACPTGVNAYLAANHFGVGHGLAANTTTLSVLMGLVTLPFWIHWVAG